MSNYEFLPFLTNKGWAEPPSNDFLNTFAVKLAGVYLSGKNSVGLMVVGLMGVGLMGVGLMGCTRIKKYEEIR